MKIETSDNKYGIENIIISVEEKTVELIIKVENVPIGKRLAEALEFQKTVAMDEGTYELDSFNVKLPAPNHIRMQGNIENILDMLKKLQVVDAGCLDELKSKIKSISFSGNSPMSDFFAVKSTPNAEQEEDLSLLSSIEEENKEAAILELFSSFKQEDRQNVLKFYELVEKLGANKENILQKLSAVGSNIPGMNKA